MFTLKHFFIIGFLIAALSGHTQSTKHPEMAKLSYLVGEWVGESTLFKGEKISSKEPAFEEISYDLNGAILVINLNTESLKLHTIINYSQTDSCYYYTPFSEQGSRRLKANLNDQKLTVHASKTKRFIFESNGDNGFREYGEVNTNGKWTLYFEDKFVNTK